jgi:hypothetical protein
VKAAIASVDVTVVCHKADHAKTRMLDVVVGIQVGLRVFVSVLGLSRRPGPGDEIAPR